MGRNLGYILIAISLLIEIPRFFGAYASIDPPFFVFGYSLPLTALATGIVLPAGTAFIFSTWWESKRQQKNFLLLPFAINLLLEGIILIPWGMAQLHAEPLADVLGSGALAWIWMSCVILSPFILVAGIAMTLAFQRGGGTLSQLTSRWLQRDDDVIPSKPIVAKTAQPVNLRERRKRLSEHLLAQPETNLNDLAIEWKVSRSTLGRDAGLLGFVYDKKTGEWLLEDTQEDE